VRRVRTVALASLAAVALAGCGLVGSGPDKTVVVELTDPKPADVAAARALLNERFADTLPHFNSSLESRVEGNRIVLVFANGAPAQEAIECRAQRGRFRLAEPDGPTFGWLTEADIEAVLPSMEVQGGRALLLVTLRADAAAKLQRYTSRHVGRQLSMRLDDRELSRATIQSPFGEQFQTPVPSALVADCAKAVIESGPLPVATRVVPA
jgi:preprotein translocase subunit SecD